MKTQFTILSIAATLLSSPLLAQSNEKINFTEENPMKSHEVIQRPAQFIIGIDCRTSNAPDAGPQDIPKLWGRFYGEDILNKIPNKVSLCTGQKINS